MSEKKIKSHLKKIAKETLQSKQSEILDLARQQFESGMQDLTLTTPSGGVISGTESGIKNMLKQGGMSAKTPDFAPQTTFAAGAAAPSGMPSLNLNELPIPPDVLSSISGALPSGLYFTFHVGGLPQILFTVVKFDLNEHLSELYDLILEVSSFKADIDLEPLLMRTGTLKVVRNGQTERTITGSIESAEQHDTSERKTYYHFRVRPALWRLTLEEDSRIFHNMTVPEIIEQILGEHQIVYQMRLAENHAMREYTTQKRESYFDFIARLAAEEGMTFWFLTEEVIFADNCVSLEPRAQMTYNPAPDNQTDGNIISKLLAKANMRPHKITNKDYVWQRPQSPTTSSKEAKGNDASELAFEVYDSYARFQDDEAAERLTRFRLDATRAESLSADAVGHSSVIMPGQVIKLSAHPTASRNADWQVVRVTHQGVMPEASENQQTEAGTQLTNQMTLISANIPWRPAFKHKPIADGDELAMVVGPAGEEIYTNEYGAVKIHFHWNRYDAKDENASHWVRVANSWNGSKGFGMVAIPRIGQEVVVSYLNGDIDRPIIIGTTFTGDDEMPLDLPAGKTKTSIRSRTHKGEGFNELSFDDDNGKQMLFLHAQKDMNTVVLDNRMTSVGTNHIETIGAHQYTSIYGNRSDAVAGQQETFVGGMHTHSVNSTLIVEAGTDIKLVAGNGEGVIHLDSQGNLNIICKNFNISAKESGQINAPSILDLNMEGGGPAIEVDSETTQSAITGKITGRLNPETE